MTTRDARLEQIDRCDEALADKPLLAAVFDAPWRAEFRANALAAPLGAPLGFPVAYGLPMLHSVTPDVVPADLQERVELGLEVIWAVVDAGDRAALVRRLKTGDGSEVDELLAAAGFAMEFGRESLSLPAAAPHERRPEFLVDSEGSAWAVECRRLFEQAAIRELNETMLATGESWVASVDPRTDRARARTAIVKKILRGQGGGPTVIVLNTCTAWLMPDEVQHEVRRILETPDAVRLDQAELPVAIAYVSMGIVQGIWLCRSACEAAGIDEGMGQRIRQAVMSGFVPRGDGQLLTEEDW